MAKILVFETDHQFAVELRTELSELGCTVQVFKDGDTGLMAAVSSKPDLILLSVELPRMNGFSVCNKLKKEATLQNVPVIVMSSESTPETFEQHKRLRTRAQDYVRKPISFADLLGHIQRFVDIDQPPRSAEAEDEDDEGGIVVDDSELTGDDEDVVERLESALPSPEPPASHPNARASAPPPQPFRAVAAPATIRGGYSPSAPPPMALPFTPGGRSFPPRTSVMPTPTPGKSFELAYGLGDEDEEEEQTKVGPRDSMPPQVAPGGPISVRPEASGDIRLQRAEAEIARLGAELGRAQAEIGKSHALAAELERLRTDAEALRRRASGDASASATRETLALREQLQGRDRDVLRLHEEASARDRELLEAREQALSFERTNADLEERLAATLDDLRRERTLAEQQAAEHKSAYELLQGEKAVAEQRAADFKAGAKKIADQLNQRATELRALTEEHATQIESLQRAHDEALRAAEDQRRTALRELEENHQAELARARADQQAAAERNAEAAQQAEARFETERSELGAKLQGSEQEVVLLESRVADLLEAQAELEQRLLEQTALIGQQQRDIAEHERVSAALENEHERMIVEGDQRHQAELTKLREEHSRTLERNAIEHDQQLRGQEEVFRDREQELTRKREALESDFQQAASEIQQLTAEIQQLTGELAATRMDRDREAAGAHEARQAVAELEQLVARERERLERARRRWGDDQAALRKAQEALAHVASQLGDTAGHPLDDD